MPSSRCPEAAAPAPGRQRHWKHRAHLFRCRYGSMHLDWPAGPAVGSLHAWHAVCAALRSGTHHAWANSPPARPLRRSAHRAVPHTATPGTLRRVGLTQMAAREHVVSVLRDCFQRHGAVGMCSQELGLASGDDPPGAVHLLTAAGTKLALRWELRSGFAAWFMRVCALSRAGGSPPWCMGEGPALSAQACPLVACLSCLPASMPTYPDLPPAATGRGQRTRRCQQRGPAARRAAPVRGCGGAAARGWAGPAPLLPAGGHAAALDGPLCCAAGQPPAALRDSPAPCTCARVRCGSAWLGGLFVSACRSKPTHLATSPRLIWTSSFRESAAWRSSCWETQRCAVAAGGGEMSVGALAPCQGHSRQLSRPLPGRLKHGQAISVSGASAQPTALAFNADDVQAASRDSRACLAYCHRKPDSTAPPFKPLWPPFHIRAPFTRTPPGPHPPLPAPTPPGHRLHPRGPGRAARVRRGGGAAGPPLPLRAGPPVCGGVPRSTRLGHPAAVHRGGRLAAARHRPLQALALH